MKILKDDDLCPSAVMRVAIDALEAAFLVRAAGQLVSPPRHHVSFTERGDIVFTVGGIDGERPIAAFRAYETFDGKEHSQLVVASPFFLSGSPHDERMLDLAAIMAGRVPGRTSSLDTTLFCSVGLAGTEVVVASTIFDTI